MARIRDVARICHEANKALCESHGDLSQSSWEDAPLWQQESAIVGVHFHLEHPDATPEDSHNSWLEVKRADGWTYGLVKDEAKKEHPCFVAYDRLPREQQAKDYLFRGIVHALRPFVDQVIEAVE